MVWILNRLVKIDFLESQLMKSFVVVHILKYQELLKPRLWLPSQFAAVPHRTLFKLPHWGLGWYLQIWLPLKKLLPFTRWEGTFVVLFLVWGCGTLGWICILFFVLSFFFIRCFFELLSLCLWCLPFVPCCLLILSFFLSSFVSPWVCGHNTRELWSHGSKMKMIQ